MKPSLAIQDLSVRYRMPSGSSIRAVDQVSLEISPGETIGLVGESGCGKSTLAYSILGVLPPNASVVAGQVLFQGQDLTSLDERELQGIRWSKIAMVFQSSMNAFSPVHRIVDQLAAVYLTHSGANKRAATNAAEKALKRVGIPAERVSGYAHEFSGGMRQRAAIALALLLEPEVLIADEPTTALDVVVQDRILRIIREWQRGGQRTVIFVSHDISVVGQMCDRIAVMYGGEIVETAETEQLLNFPRHPYTQALLNCRPQLRGARSRLVTLPGYPPDLSAPPADACRFAPRCTARVAHDVKLSTELAPQLRSVSATHDVRCWIYHDAAGRLRDRPLNQQPSPRT